MKTVHAEVEYENDGRCIHSDICPDGCDFDNLDEHHRQILHDCLDEWINMSGGTGGFYIKAEGHMIQTS